MEEMREQKIRLWFNMWLQAKDLGMEDLFASNCTYIESWGPRYEGRDKVALWFREWNTRGKVVRWDGEDRIAFLQEFGCNNHNYDPYAAGGTPVFRDEPSVWF